MTHAPKIAALSALSERTLSPRARLRIERHLATCDVCRRALASIRLYRRTAEEVRDAEVPELDWSRMELALAREARAQSETVEREGSQAPAPRRASPPSGSRRLGLRAALPYLAIAAALLLVVWARLGGERIGGDRMGGDRMGGDRMGGEPLDSGDELASTEPTSPAVDEVHGVDPSPSEPAALLATATLVAGQASVREQSGDARAVRVGDALGDDTTVIAESASELHLRLASASGVVVRQDSEARLARMREGDVEIALERGRLVSVVGAASFGAESRFVVMAAEHRLEGHATRFEVELDETTRIVRLWIAEGTVRVHRPDGRTDVVSAPGSWSNDVSGASIGEVGRAHGIADETLAWPVLRVSHPDVVRWEVGDVAVGGVGELAMRVGAGQLAIAGFDASGRAFRTAADVGGDGLTIDATGLVPEAPRVRTDGYLPSHDIQEVVRRGLPRLRQCYELGLRARPDLEGTVTMRFVIGLDGSVSRARILGGDVPAELSDCVRNYAERWTFPPPRGGTVTFDVPLSFGGR